MTPIAKTADRVDQRVILVDAAKKRDMLVELFNDPELTPHARLHPHQARRRPRRQDAGGSGNSRRGDPRQQEPGPARARAGGVPRRQDAGAGGHRHRRARHRHRRRQPRRQFRTARRRRGLCPPHRPHRARGQGRSGDFVLRRRGARSVARDRAADAATLATEDRRGAAAPPPAPVRVKVAASAPRPPAPRAASRSPFGRPARVARPSVRAKFASDLFGRPRAFALTRSAPRPREGGGADVRSAFR